MKIFEILFYFFVFNSIILETQVFKKVKQNSAQRSLHLQAQENYTKQMTDLMQVRAEKLKLDRSLIQRDIDRIKRDPIFKHKGVYGVIPQGKSGRLKVVHKIDKVTNKQPAKLTKTIENRFITRKPNPGQQQCGLWIRIGSMEYHSQFKQSRSKIIFRSNCQSGPEIKYFVLNKQPYIPEYLQFKIGDKSFTIKYDKNSFSSRGRASKMIQYFTRFRLTRAQKEKIRREQVEQDKSKCMDRCKFQRGRQRTICQQRCQLRHRYVPRHDRKLLQKQITKQQQQNLNLENLKDEKINIQSNSKQQKSEISNQRILEEKNVQQENKVDNTQNNNKERNLELKKIKKENQKERELRAICDCKYCQHKRFAIEKRYCKRACDARCENAQAELSSRDIAKLHIPYKSSLSTDEVLSPGSHENQTGFFDFSLIDAMWNSPSIISARTGTQSEKSMYIVQGKHRGRPFIKKKLMRRIVMFASIA